MKDFVVLLVVVLFCLFNLSNGRPQNRFSPREGATSNRSSSNSSRNNDFKREGPARKNNDNVVFPDEGRRLSKTEEAIRNLNLTKFLPSVPLSKFYVRPEFDLSGNRIFFDDEGQDLEDSATQVPPQKSRPETSRPKPRGFPESERSQNVLFSEPDHILKVTELLRGEDSDHHNFIVPGVVNAGVLPLASEDVEDNEDDLEDFPPFTRKRAKSKKPK